MPGGRSILLVEDHQDTRHMLSCLLTHFGHQVLTAGNTRSALDIVASENIEVLLCDIGLPDGSGYDVISQAQQNRPIKAVALTGFGTDADLRRSKEAGFDFHLVNGLVKSIEAQKQSIFTSYKPFSTSSRPNCPHFAARDRASV